MHSHINSKTSGISTTLHHWSRCNIPFEIDGSDVLPKKCTPYTENALNDDPKILSDALSEVVTDFKSDESQVAFVYYPTIDTLGHKYGPNSEEILTEVRHVDDVISGFLHELEANDLASTTNIVIVSDHGMSDNRNRVRFLVFHSGWTIFLNFCDISDISCSHKLCQRRKLGQNPKLCHFIKCGLPHQGQGPQ